LKCGSMGYGQGAKSADVFRKVLIVRCQIWQNANFSVPNLIVEMQNFVKFRRNIMEN
jgi:hypothetical protein